MSDLGCFGFVIEFLEISSQAQNVNLMRGGKAKFYHIIIITLTFLKFFFFSSSIKANTCKKSSATRWSSSSHTKVPKNCLMNNHHYLLHTSIHLWNVVWPLVYEKYNSLSTTSDVWSAHYHSSTIIIHTLKGKLSSLKNFLYATDLGLSSKDI